MFSNWMTPTNAPAPDIILEVGPPPFARYAAHSVLLSANSGYLRSAMRPDAERKYEAPIYLPSITADQFGPLLTYMYTGFLDLNTDNIFAVLLASHVLHMPRASEICRAYLARAQSESFIGGTFEAGAAHSERVGNTKIVRPIASKASASGLCFVAPPISSVLVSSTDTPFKSLIQCVDEDRASTPIVVTDSCETPTVEIIRAEPPVKFKNTSKKRPTQFKSGPNKKPAAAQFEAAPESTATICEVVEDPVKLNENRHKTIIDIASCDGPVRFRRVLNEAYGRPAPSMAAVKTAVERTHQNVVTSFHAQMAKTISEQQHHHPAMGQLSCQSDATSENSQEINVSSEAVNPEPPPGDAVLRPSTIAKPTEEVFSCVYCKHTFKSQYCYQKHAKRHINPLTIDDTERIVETIDSDSADDRSSSGGAACRKKVVMRREVRPLDMNVQYYPCKTCGSKFPSYYFVHKHRKLCHANEEN